MPKSKEFVESSDDSDFEPKQKKSVSKKEKRQDSEEEEPKQSKKPRKEAKNEEESVWDLGNNRNVTVRDFKGKLYVDIREMYFDKEGDLKPGKKGICMNMQQWRKFMEVVSDVDKAVKAKC